MDIIRKIARSLRVIFIGFIVVTGAFLASPRTVMAQEGGGALPVINESFSSTSYVL